MEKQQKMTARCGKRLLARPGNSGWVLGEECPAGQPEGLVISELLNRCQACSRVPVPSPPGKIQIISMVPRLEDLVQDAPTALAPPAPPSVPVPPSALPVLPAAAPPPPAIAPPSPAAAVVPQPAEMPAVPLQTPPVAPPPEPVAPPAPVLSVPMLPFEVDVEPVSSDPVLLPPAAPVQQALPPPPAVLPAEPAVELDSLGSIVLPSGFSLESIMDPESSVDIDAVVKAGMPDLPGGPSEGGLSPHTLEDARCWRLFYLLHVLGLRPMKASKALQFGSLFHYCLAARYLLGRERQYEPCTLVAQAGAAELAAEVKRLIEGMVAKYEVEEWETWCVRAVEYNMASFIECPVGNRTVKLPITCRLDLVLGTKEPKDPHPAGGPLVNGVLLVDHKTSSGITRDLLEGYGLDWQFNVQAVVFEEGGYEKVFGPLRGTLVNLASKARKTPTPDSYARPRAPLSKAVLAEFRDVQLRQLAGEVYRRISDDTIRQDVSQWPKDFRQCHGRWGRCRYFEICEGMLETVSAVYVQDDSLLCHPDNFIKPKGESLPPADKEKKAQAKKAKVVDPIADQMLNDWGWMVHGQIEAATEEPFINLKKEKFLKVGATKEGVIKDLSGELKLAYDGFVAGKVKQVWNGATWSFLKTGISWQTESSKGRITWKGLATWICENIWYDLSKAMPV